MGSHVESGHGSEASFEAGRTDDRTSPPDYSEPIAQPSRHRVLIVGFATGLSAIALAAWRLHSGLAEIGDSGSYLAGASGFAHGRFFETPLVPSFSEVPLLDTVRAAGWSPYADFGIGLPLVIALFDLFVPLTTAATLVGIVSIGLIALGVVIGPWAPTRHGELWLRSGLGIALSCWPILRFTAAGVLSEPLFCAALIWLVVMIARTVSPRTSWLVSMGVLTVAIGTLRFVGPIVAITVGVLLVQRGVRFRRAAVWTSLTAIGPLALTSITAGRAGTRHVSVHALDTSDVFFAARGVGGWFEAGLGDQTSTLLRTNFHPTVGDWMITVCAAIGALAVIALWIRGIRRRVSSPLEPAPVLAVMLALAVVPSMIFIDAVVKLENRILMPSGLLVLGAAGWWLGRRAPALLGWSVLALWTVVATHPWQWLDRLDPPRSTSLTDAVRSLEPAYVVTDQADLVWWITRIPARYLPDGYHDLSDRHYDIEPIMSALPCALVRTGGLIVVDMATISPTIADQLATEVDAENYSRREMPGRVTAFAPTGNDC